MAFQALKNFRLSKSSSNTRITEFAQETLTAELDAKPIPNSINYGVDTLLFSVTVALIGFGVLMVYSASTVQATTHFHDPEFYLKRQAIYALISVFMMGAVSFIPYQKLYKLTYPVLLSVALLLIVCLTGFGHSGGGATRWIELGPIHIQPAELAKLSLVTWLAYSLSKKADRVKDFSVGFLPHLLVAAVFMFLCMKQPDFGSAIVLAFLTFTLLFVAGAKIGYILGAGVLAGIFAVVSIMFKSYRMARYLAWSNMNEHKQDLAYQPFQSVMSFGSGGTFGVGLGKGLQTLYLPEAHTDFISAIVGEEFGYVGICLLMLAYALLVFRAIHIALHAPDDYGSYMAIGIAAMFAIQALFNLSVALSLVPTKGLTLPFLSYGGSSLMMNACAVGLLLSISRQIKPQKEFSNQETPLPSKVEESPKKEAHA